MNGNIQYIGPGKWYQVFEGDRGVDAEKYGKYVSLPLHRCKILIESGEFIPDNETAKILSKYEPKGLSMKIEGMLSGKRCFIIGGGRSLKGFDYSKLDNDFSIVLNHSINLYPKASALLFIDEKFIERETFNLGGYEGLIFSAYRTAYNGIDRRKNVFSFALNMANPQRKYVFGLYNGSLSGLAALNLALIMDASKIYLLGYDLLPPEEDGVKAGKSIHCYDDNKVGNGKNYKNPKWCSAKIEMFKKFLPWKDRIVVCNQKSGLEFFKYESITKVLRRKS